MLLVGALAVMLSAQRQLVGVSIQGHKGGRKAVLIVFFLFEVELGAKDVKVHTKHLKA